MINFIKRSKKNLTLFTVGAIATVQVLMSFVKKKEESSYEKIKKNKNEYIEYFYDVNRAKKIVNNVDIEKEIDKRVEWFQNDLMNKISEENQIVKFLEIRARTARTKREKEAFNEKLDNYIIHKYLDVINTERTITGKEPYCLGFVMSNMLNYDEFKSAFENFPGVAKLANKYFVLQARMEYPDYIHNAKQKSVKPEVGDIIVICRPNGTYHAVTYIGDNKTFSANGSDHGGQSELKKVNFSHWWIRAQNLYIFKSKDIVKKYWQDKYNEGKMNKLEFLSELYKGRVLPYEVDILIKEEEKMNKTFFSIRSNDSMQSDRFDSAQPKNIDLNIPYREGIDLNQHYNMASR